MLIGQFKVSLTQKGRLAVPARFRRELGKKLVITKWVEGCLVVISQERLNEILERLMGGRDISQLSVREIERFVLGSAFEIELDSQGRFVVPQILKEYGKIVNEAVFIGLGDRVEVWNRQSWFKKEKKLQEDAGKWTEKFSEKTFSDKNK
jgi:MraZ protein